MAVGEISAHHAYTIHRARDDARHLVIKPRDIAHHLGGGCAREQGYTVVGFLAAERGAVARCREFRHRKVGVLGLGFLKAHDVGCLGRKPGEEPRQPDIE